MLTGCHHALTFCSTAMPSTRRALKALPDMHKIMRLHMQRPRIWQETLYASMQTKQLQRAMQLQNVSAQQAQAWTPGNRPKQAWFTAGGAGLDWGVWVGLVCCFAMDRFAYISVGLSIDNPLKPPPEVVLDYSTVNGATGAHLQNHHAAQQQAAGGNHPRAPQLIPVHRPADDHGRDGTDQPVRIAYARIGSRLSAAHASGYSTSD